MKHFFSFSGLLLFFGLAQIASAQTPALSEPSLSPDGQEIAFVSGGDIWTVPLSGGEARLLVSHEATESRPLYSPDGRRLAFVSTRTGNGDVYVFHFDSGTLDRLTFDDGNDQLSAWARDGKSVYFHSLSRDIAGMNDVFRVSTEGGTPMPVSADRYANEFFAAPSPDGSTLAFSARGTASAQWWRKGRSHLDEAELWLRRGDAAQPRYERLTEPGAKDLWPMWSADGQALFYVSDRTGPQNLWLRPLNGPALQLTPFTEGRVLWPFLGYDGRTLVFERDFGIWKFDVASKQASLVPVKLRGAAAGAAVEHLKLTNQFREMALSPDGKKVAFVVHGEVFAAPAKDGGDATRISHSAGVESQLAWSPDSRRLVYASDRDGVNHLFSYDFVTRTETRLTNGAADDDTPKFSPDGTQLAFQRQGRELRVLDVATRKDRLLATGYLRFPTSQSGEVVWSPDGRWLAYAAYGAKTFRNVSVVPLTGGGGKPVSFLGNTFGGNLSWSPDGTYLLFNTTQRTEDVQLARVDLIPRTPKFREDRFRDLFQEEAPKTLTPGTPPPVSAKGKPKTPVPTDSVAAAKPAKKPVKITFEGIAQRLSLLPVGLDVQEQVISPDGKTLLLISTVARQQNLYTYSLDELAKEPPVAKQLTSTSGSKRDAQFSPDGKEVFYLEDGKIQTVALEARTPKPLSVTAELDADFTQEKNLVFRQAWEIQNKTFYDSTFHGINWPAVRERYAPLAAASRTPGELRRLLSLMVGELNASHSGISAPPGNAQSSTGRLGLRFDPAEYERSGKLRVAEVIALSPAAVAGGIQPGDYLLAVDDTLVGPRTNLDALLENTIARRVTLRLSSSASGEKPREVDLRPVNLNTEKGLLYKQWVQDQREYVAKQSGGRLGYVHMIDMSAESLAQFYLDLDAENHAREGVVVDVRNNNGGFVNAYALDALSRKGYLTMTPRGMPAAPARSQLGQRALEAPTILVTNQHSLSDAEDFAEGYRTLKLGKVVGEPTAGWIIYTSAAQLLDGSVLRVPFIKITDNTGADMELVPRPVDVAVTRPIGESYTDKNSQLEVAVKELLKQLDEARTSRVSGGK